MPLTKQATNYYRGELCLIDEVSNSTIQKANLDYEKQLVGKNNQEKYDELIAEGYVEKKHTTKSIILGKPKKHDSYWEEKIWSILCKMNFEYINTLRNFDLKYDENDYKQIDIIVADEDTILIIECKSAETQKKADQKEIIEAYARKLSELRKSSQQIFDGKQKIAFIWATRNIKLNDPSKRALKRSKIHNLNENDFLYFEEMVKHLGSAAKYQLCGKLFDGQKIPELTNENKVPAISGKLGGHQYYLFSIHPSYLLKTSFIFHRSDTSQEKLDTYQRIITKSRLNQIRDFVSSQGFFANSLIVNLSTEKKLQYDIAQYNKKDKDGKRLYQTSMGILHLPIEYKSAWIIDGQHRLYGYSDANLEGQHSINVMAFENLAPNMQKDIFVQINSKQKSVKQNLLQSLLAEFKWGSKDLSDGLQAFKIILISRLNDDQGSPLYQRIQLSEEGKTEIRCLTLTTIMSWAFKKSSLYFPILQGSKMIHPGYLSVFKSNGDFHYKESLDKSFSFFCLLYDYISDNLTENWNIGSGSGGFISMNLGIASISKIVEELIEFELSNNKSVNINALNHDEIFVLIQPYLEPLINYIKSLDSFTISEFRSHFGSGGVPHVVKHYQKYFYEYTKGEFEPNDLKDWLSQQEGIFKIDCVKIDIEIRPLIRNKIIGHLQNIWGEDQKEWFGKGCPKNVKLRCMKGRMDAVSQGHDEKEDYQYLNFIDYKEIVMDSANYQELIPYFTPPGLENNKKEVKLKWMVDYNKLRNKFSHDEEREEPITKNDYDLLSTIANWIRPKLQK